MAQFSSEDVGTWYHFDPTDEAAGGVCLRLPTEEEYRFIDKTTVISSKKKAYKGVLYDDIKHDEVKQTKLRWRVMIIDWKNVCLDNQPLKCTDENKDRMRKVNTFKIWLGGKIEKLLEEAEELKEALAKNLPTSSNGSVEEPST